MLQHKAIFPICFSAFRFGGFLFGRLVFFFGFVCLVFVSLINSEETVSRISC